VRLYLIASKPTDSVNFGFLPAAGRLGLDVALLTDRPEEHERALASSRLLPRPGCPPGDGDHRADTVPARIVACDVWDPAGLIGAIAALPRPDAVFSNSDHLQAQTALAAAYFGVPGKDWRAAMRARHKPLMRRWLAGTGTERVTATEIRPDTRHPLRHLAFPVVLKPAAGVASEDVMLVGGPDELAVRCAQIFARRPGQTLIAEQYLPGVLRTVETLGDGVTTWVLGGFRTRLSPPPFFVEERLTWDAPPPAAEKHVLTALAGLGVTFGACHTEYVLDAVRGPALIEVNDRMIGDHGDFLLADLLGTDLFELVLRVHLGEPLPPGAPPKTPPGRAHAVIDYVVADRPGVLATAGPAARGPAAEPGVMFSCRPLRAAGDRIARTNTNRDYLAVIIAIGADPGAVDRSVAALRAAGSWQVTEPRP